MTNRLQEEVILARTRMEENEALLQVSMFSMISEKWLRSSRYNHIAPLDGRFCDHFRLG